VSAASFGYWSCVALRHSMILADLTHVVTSLCIRVLSQLVFPFVAATKNSVLCYCGRLFLFIMTATNDEL